MPTTPPPRVMPLFAPIVDHLVAPTWYVPRFDHTAALFQPISLFAPLPVPTPVPFD